VQAYLILKLQGPLQSWGTHTYEDYRPSNLFPTQSGLLGLLAACLGIERHDQAGFEALDQSIELAVRVDQTRLEDGKRLSPAKITDFHTIMNARRVDGRASRYPVVSRREYLCDATFTVAIRASAQPTMSLDELEAAVKKPYYTPFLGRRSCPLSRPLWEQRLMAESFEQALGQVEPRLGVIYSEWIGFEHSRLQLRDVPLRTTRRQFATRYVNIKSVTTREESSDVPQ
jgi:CRISPR system Cascade subunit CasD